MNNYDTYDPEYNNLWNDAGERQRIMLDAMPLCCSFWDQNYHVIDCNQEAVDLFDLCSKQEYLDRYFELSPDLQPDGQPSRDKWNEKLAQAFELGRLKFEWMFQKLTGEQVPSEVILVRVQRDKGYIVVSYTRDLRELKETVALMTQLEALAFTDSLTGIYNRRYFLDTAMMEFIKASCDSSSVSIIMFDLDHFKVVNDTYGHAAGDEILKAVCVRVKSVLRGNDIFARYGGEEFLILVPGADTAFTQKLAQRICDAVAESPFACADDEITVTLSLGVATRSNDMPNVMDVVQCADRAVYRAKMNGRNRVEVGC